MNIKSEYLLLSAIPGFAELLVVLGRSLSDYIQREFDEFLKCGRFGHGFRVCGTLIVIPNISWVSAVNISIVARTAEPAG